jgi:hypothetical protein
MRLWLVEPVADPASPAAKVAWRFGCLDSKSGSPVVMRLYAAREARDELPPNIDGASFELKRRRCEGHPLHFGPGWTVNALMVSSAL